MVRFIVVALIAASAACYGAPNLITNGGFEGPDGGISGKLAGVGASWETICGGPHPEIYALDCCVKHSGEHSQRMTCAGYNYKGYCFDLRDGAEVRHPVPTELGLQAIAQTTKPGAIQPGREYGCSVWVKIDGLTDPWEWFRLGVYWLDANGHFLGETREDREADKLNYGTHDWKRVSLRATAPARAASAKVYLHHHFVHGTVWYDDVWFGLCR